MGGEYGDVEFIGAAPVEIEPVVEPPPPRELALCEFLFAHEGDGSLRELVDRYMPDGLFAHGFTRRFVAAWRSEIEAGGDAFAQLRAELPAAECVWLDGILLGAARDGLSELGPVRILQDMLRHLWVAAVRRRQGLLPAASTPENDLLRLELSTRARSMLGGPWEKAAPLMKIDWT